MNLVKKLIKKSKKHKLLLFCLVGIVVLCIYMNKTVEYYTTTEFKDVDSSSSCFKVGDYLKQQQNWNNMRNELEKIKALQDKEIEKRMKEKEESNCNKTTTTTNVTDEQLKAYLLKRMKDKLKPNLDKLVSKNYNDLLANFGESTINLSTSKLSDARMKLHDHLHNFHDGNNPKSHDYDSHDKKIKDSVNDKSHLTIKTSKIVDVK